MVSVPQPAGRLSAPSSFFVIVTVMAVGAAIVGAVLAAPAHVDGWRVLHWIGKPLATLLLLGLAGSTVRPLSMRYRRRVCAGLLCALLGDVLLMLPGDFFVPGLVAFLCGHVCFIAAWLDDSRFGVRPPAWLACLAAAAVLVVLLWPRLAPALRLPVIVYAAVLACMAGQALGRAAWHAALRDALAAPARRAAFGGVCFMVSDSLLAWDRFRAPLPLAPLWILGSYYLALWAIARSVARPSASENA